MLKTYEFGTETTRPPLLIAHGLFGSARNWTSLAKALSARRRVVVVDMRNHGESPWQDRHDYPSLAEDLGAVAGDGWDVIGHSMGGKAAMVLALLHPARVGRLLVADIAPVAYSHTQMALVEAMRGLDLSSVKKRSDADALLAKTVEEAGIRAFLLQSLDPKARRWTLNLDALARHMGDIMDFPKISERFEGEVTFLSGGQSDYVQQSHRQATRAFFPAARFAKIPGAGHWLHAEKPKEFLAAAEAVFN